ncbi:MAG: hypothetical protein GY820_29925 [Gammaproteobacteria bacterium]|nr:hypothetical protein [Gammaproteobacteria bacterium]
MTIISPSLKETYQGNGLATTFAYTFKVFARNDGTATLKVTHKESSGVETVLTENIHYTVSGIRNDVGGTITYPISGPALALGQTLTLTPSLEVEQETDLINQGDGYKQVIEEKTDDVTTICKQQQEQLNGALKTKITSDFNAFIFDDITITVGNNGEDFTTVTDALNSIRGKFIAPTAKVTIQLAADDTITESREILWDHPDSARILVVGEGGRDLAETTITGQVAIDGGERYWRPTLAVGDASVIGSNNENSNYVIVQRCEPDLARTQEGCWKVLDNDIDGQGGLGGANRVQLKNTYSPEFWQGGGIGSGHIHVLTTKWRVHNIGAIFVSAGATLKVRNLAMVGRHLSSVTIQCRGGVIDLERVGLIHGRLYLNSASARCYGTAISEGYYAGIHLEQSHMDFALSSVSGVAGGLPGPSSIHLYSGSSLNMYNSGIYGCHRGGIFLDNDSVVHAYSAHLYGNSSSHRDLGIVVAKGNSTLSCRNIDIWEEGNRGHPAFESRTGSFIDASGSRVRGTYQPAAYSAHDQGRIKRGSEGETSCSPPVDIEGNHHSYISSS